MLKPFFVWQQRVLRQVNPEEVMCLVTFGNYTKIYLSDQSYYLVRSSLANATKKLPSGMFIRVHRSFAVSIYHIHSIYNDHLVVCEKSIPIDKIYHKAFIAQLNIIE
jgi:DNA-binding LytR/AlgR family response regulator